MDCHAQMVRYDDVTMLPTRSFKIGPHVIDPPFLLAPMASVSEMPFRVLALEMGAGLATTELISANGIFYKNRRTRQYMTFDRNKERPYSLQLFGGDAIAMAEAARQSAEHGADIIDINMGCPVKKVTKTGSGSALLCDLPRAGDLVRAMRKAVDDKVPVTVKIRAGWDDTSINCVEMAKQLEDAGCAAVALHARTRAQGYSGHANWDLIRDVKNAVQMPVIGNGDVVTFEDAQRMLVETGCDGVMIGRGALGNPWLFESLREGRALPPPPPDVRFAFIRRHLRAHVAFHELLDDDVEVRKLLRVPPAHMAVRTFRQHLVWYSRGLQGGSLFRKEVMQLEDPHAVEDALDRFFSGAHAELAEVGREDAEEVNYNAAFG
jgi:nifR3 family TIM-barrel protein